MVGDAVHQFRTEPKGLVPGRNSRPADILVESDTVFAMEYDGQRLCVDVTAVTTLGLPLPRSQWHDQAPEVWRIGSNQGAGQTDNRRFATQGHGPEVYPGSSH